jgi:hypothetical protein
MADFESFHVKRNAQQVTVMQQDGTAHNNFFQCGNVDCFVEALTGNVRTAR